MRKHREKDRHPFGCRSFLHMVTVHWFPANCNIRSPHLKFCCLRRDTDGILSYVRRVVKIKINFFHICATSSKYTFCFFQTVSTHIMLYLFCCLTYTKATWKGGDVVGAYYFAYCFRYGRCDLPPHLQMVGRKRLKGQPA